MRLYFHEHGVRACILLTCVSFVVFAYVRVVHPYQVRSARKEMLPLLQHSFANGYMSQNNTTRLAWGLPIFINSATSEEISALPNIGTHVAHAIVVYRNTQGFFQSCEDLDSVPGIGPVTLAHLCAHVLFTTH